MDEAQPPPPQVVKPESDRTLGEPQIDHPVGEPRFAHPSEREFARILTFYQIEWQYEPRTFPLRHASDGRVVESFSPDFYLPELDLYVELTTLKQSLVTKKNRKLRRLRELFPDVNIRLFYNRDFRSLMRKYGIRGLLAERSAVEQIEPLTARVGGDNLDAGDPLQNSD
jgi:hypothetical protein